MANVRNVTYLRYRLDGVYRKHADTKWKHQKCGFFAPPAEPGPMVSIQFSRSIPPQQISLIP